jgi:hypothetical protein
VETCSTIADRVHLWSEARSLAAERRHRRDPAGVGVGCRVERLGARSAARSALGCSADEAIASLPVGRADGLLVDLSVRGLG